VTQFRTTIVFTFIKENGNTMTLGSVIIVIG